MSLVGGSLPCSVGNRSGMESFSPSSLGVCCCRVRVFKTGHRKTKAVTAYFVLSDRNTHSIQEATLKAGVVGSRNRKRPVSPSSTGLGDPFFPKKDSSGPILTPDSRAHPLISLAPTRVPTISRVCRLVNLAFRPASSRSLGSVGNVEARWKGGRGFPVDSHYLHRFEIFDDTRLTSRYSYSGVFLFLSALLFVSSVHLRAERHIGTFDIQLSPSFVWHTIMTEGASGRGWLILAGSSCLWIRKK